MLCSRRLTINTTISCVHRLSQHLPPRKERDQITKRLPMSTSSRLHMTSLPPSTPTKVSIFPQTIRCLTRRSSSPPIVASPLPIMMLTTNKTYRPSSPLHQIKSTKEISLKRRGPYHKLAAIRLINKYTNLAVAL